MTLSYFDPLSFFLEKNLLKFFPDRRCSQFFDIWSNQLHHHTVVCKVKLSDNRYSWISPSTYRSMGRNFITDWPGSNVWMQRKTWRMSTTPTPSALTSRWAQLAAGKFPWRRSTSKLRHMPSAITICPHVPCWARVCV